MTEHEVKEQTQAMTIRVTKTRHEWLRRLAFDRHVTMNDLINEALDAAEDTQPEQEISR